MPTTRGGDSRASIRRPPPRAACPSGHALQLAAHHREVPKPYGGGTWNCDVCKSKGHTESRLHCNPCQYDLCEACSVAKGFVRG